MSNTTKTTTITMDNLEFVNTFLSGALERIGAIAGESEYDNELLKMTYNDLVLVKKLLNYNI